MPETGPARPRLLSGMQPTSDSLHLGNYIGALANWVELQEQYEAYFFIADLHTITMGHDPKALRSRSHRYIAQYLAAGIDPAKSVLFAQSHVPEHPRLSWVLECLTGFGEAGRMTQFKDKSHKDGTEGATVGLFTYPILQAADILLYRPAVVPVGEDQRQHLELTRDLAQRFNKRFGKTFRVPEPHIVKATAKIVDLQNPDKKMSGSIGGPGCLWLLDDPKVSAKKIRSAVTDTGRDIVFDPENKPGVSNLLTILSVLGTTPIADLEVKFQGAGYGDLKKEVAAVYEEFAAPIAEKANALIADPGTLDDILADGAARAQQTTARVLAEVYDRVGFLPPRR
ncbi:tryptophan--tRNA ligase [Kineosporia sp. J2-2]|uniref:Tryptophan--tRNA ligase n=2 Tax=Kineosporia corallincola TaxID=2835133 RepID=A0ABS5TA88_9ACTN|nr:tryptophan--tRNA ligase [Kineosporia corallincola]MBT0767961.1 tryptophan--tRNA ligase [Kineosporia corallincola]